MSSQADMFCYLLPDSGMLGQKLAKELRRKSVRERNSVEMRWYYTILQEAYLAWNGLVSDAALVVIAEGLGGLIEDEEVIASTRAVPPWMAAIDKTDWVKAAQSTRDPGPGPGKSTVRF